MKFHNFKCFPKSIGELPTSYRESISYEEQILWLCNFIEKEVLPRFGNFTIYCWRNRTSFWWFTKRSS